VIAASGSCLLTYYSFRPHGTAKAQTQAAEPETLTGVFHKLDTDKAKLTLVQVVFR
jgi:hypothetical protein